MSAESVWSKDRITIKEVETALGLFVDALEGGPKKAAAAEEHLHATVMAYVRTQAHRKFPRSDGARSVDNSSALAGDVLLYLYSRRHLPAFIQSVRDNPTNEAKLEFVKRLQSLIALKLRRLPVDWARTRERIPKSFPVLDDLSAVSVEGTACSNDSADFRELSGVVEKVLSVFDGKDQEILRHRLFEGSTFAESAKRLDMKPDAVRKRYGNAVRRLQEELTRLGYEM